MRSVVLSNRIRCLNSVGLIQVLTLGLVGVLAAGCSSDASRFDQRLYAALPQTQTNQYGQTAAASQVYPGDLDRSTTAAIGGSRVPTPLSSVSSRTIPDHGGYATNVAQPHYRQIPQQQYRAPAYQQPNYPQRRAINMPAPYSPPAPSTYKPAPTYNSGIVKSALPKPVNSALAKPVYSALPKPRLSPTPSVVAKQVITDKVQTNSVATQTAVKNQTRQYVAKQIAPVASVAAPVASVANAVNGGWSSVGGTRIQMRSGETLYNLSKRYGVPVKEIMRANNIASASDLQAGKNILIPTYVYSQNAPVSAPDSNPDTRAARSTTGLLGQARTPFVAVPTHRPQYHAALTPSAVEETGTKRRYKPKRSAAEPEGQANPPDYSIVTGSISKPEPVKRSTSPFSGGLHTVQAGDSLGKIAKQHGVSVSALQQANGLNSTIIRLGQKLTIPGRGAVNTTLTRQLPPGVDPIVTGGTQKAKEAPIVKPKPYVKPTVDKTIATGAVAKDAPKSTGIKTLRWPVKGRVVSNFGKSNDGIDISVPVGTSVKAAENGVVLYSGNELAGFGNLVLIRHADGIVTAYAHNKSNAVSKGSRVKRGQVIAKSGRSGNTQTPKLHFEVRKNSKPVNPIPYLGG